jgi:hypothetical protein
MKDSPAVYLGKIVSKHHFRVYVYASNGSQKLVESWDEYEREMATGLWFATKEEAEITIKKPLEEEIKIKTRKTRKSSVKLVEESDPIGVLGELGLDSESSNNEDLGFEVTNNDEFLPKTAR